MVPRCYRLPIMAQTVETTCTECGQPITLTVGHKVQTWKRTGRAYCSDPCRTARMSRLSSARMAATNRKYASERMRERNPMRRPESVEKMRASLQRIGHQPTVRGGNGKPLSEPQKALANALMWPTEWVVKTGKPRRPGVPTCYKVDIANPTLKVAVEVDGASHGLLARREADRRKDEFLSGSGWLVLRYSNQEVMADTAGIARTVLSTTSMWLARTPTSSVTE